VVVAARDEDRPVVDQHGVAAGGEFADLVEVAAEVGAPADSLPVVRRLESSTSGGTVSYLKWGVDQPRLVLLHGGGQNARTWDLVAMTLGQPAVAIDLPGHGHSAWRADHDYSPGHNADTVRPVIEQVVSSPVVLVGMSLGGLTAIRLASAFPALFCGLVLVDVTPGVGRRLGSMTAAQRDTTALMQGPPIYDTLDEMAAAAIALAPRRPAAALRRGVRHNGRQLPDGRWTWRYDVEMNVGSRTEEAFTGLWRDVDRLDMPLMLVRGSESAFVAEPDVVELRRRQPRARIEDVAGAGHAVQSDRPAQLAALITDFAFRADER
jgi:pimeloyl-ACP methyl ester carboxylesterase